MLETGLHGVHLVVGVKKLNRDVFYLVLVCLESSLIWFLLKVVVTLCGRGAGDGSTRCSSGGDSEEAQQSCLLIWFLLRVDFTLCAGVVLETGQHGVHLVVEVNMLNPSSRIQPGDEIVQVNYQTVVGWQTKKVTD